MKVLDLLNSGFNDLCNYLANFLEYFGYVINMLVYEIPDHIKVMIITSIGISIMIFMLGRN